MPFPATGTTQQGRECPATEWNSWRSSPACGVLYAIADKRACAVLDSAVVVECGIDAALQGAARRRRPGATAQAQGGQHAP